jgi:DNA-directed RNA polymerase specialized sigma24 family protein
MLSDDELQAEFEKRFAVSFGRVYAYVSKRTASRVAAERLTRDILASALREIFEDEAELAGVLLRTANQMLRVRAAPAPEAEAATDAQAPARVLSRAGAGG